MFIGGFILGIIITVIFSIAFITAYNLYFGEETKQSDKREKKTQFKRSTESNGGIRYGDGLDVEYWL